MHAGLQPDLTYRLLHRAQNSNDLDAHEQDYLRFGTYAINRRAEGDGINWFDNLVVGKGLVACLTDAPPGDLAHRFALLWLSGCLML